MTLRNGAVQLGVIDSYNDSTHARTNIGHSGTENNLGIGLGNNIAVVKNYGNFSGSVEVWLTFGFVGGTTNPNTGHVCTNVRYIVLSGSL